MAAVDQQVLLVWKYTETSVSWNGTLMFWMPAEFFIAKLPQLRLIPFHLISTIVAILQSENIVFGLAKNLNRIVDGRASNENTVPDVSSLFGEETV